VSKGDYKVYGYRWVVLLAFMFINITIQMLWICFAAISSSAEQFYGVSDLEIGLLAMIFMVVYVFVGVPASWIIDTFGFKRGVGFGAVLMAIFGLLRGFFSYDYNHVLIFTIGLAVAQPFLLNSFSKVAALWFSLEERATAIGLVTLASFSGTAIGLALTPSLLGSMDIPAIQILYGGIAAFSTLVFLVLAKDKPLTPPCPPEYEERALMFDGLKQILKQKEFYLVLVVFFIGFGVFNGVLTWIEGILLPRGFDSNQAGMAGMVILLGAIAGAVVISTLSDKFLKRKPFLLLGMICAIPGLIGITFVNSYGLLLVSAGVMGFFLMGMGPVAYQYSAEITYPAPEGTSNGLIVISGQISVVLIFIMEAMKSPEGYFTPSLLLLTGLMCLNVILIALLKESKMLSKGAPASPAVKE